MPSLRPDVIRSWPALALAGLIVATIVGFVVYPTYPNYDSYYSLLWGRELLHGHRLSFQTYYAPTQHPLAIAFGALLSLIGRDADRVMVFCTLGSFVLLCAGLYRFGRLLFGPLVGLVAAAILITRFDFPFLAARAYIDVPYLALVIWAVALEWERPGRGGIVWLLLLGAGLLRPEAWILLGLYGLWLAVRVRRTGAGWGAVARSLGRSAAISAIAPLIWCGTDYLVTGHPFFSLTHTSAFAEELGRTKGAAEIPSAMKAFFLNLTKAPVLAAGIVGAALAFWFAPRRALLPAVLWLIGSGTFVLIGLAGLSVIDRYLLVPALMVMVFAAVTVGGFTMLRPSRLRNIWMVLAVAAVAYAVVFTATRVNLTSLTSELERRGRSHEALVALLDSVKDKDCLPIGTPNHKLVPEVRWVADLADGQVLARQAATGASDTGLAPADRRRRGRVAARLRSGGTELYIVDRSTLFKQGLVSPQDDIFNEIPVYVDGSPVKGFEHVAANRYYSVYALCARAR